MHAHTQRKFSCTDDFLKFELTIILKLRVLVIFYSESNQSEWRLSTLQHRASGIKKGTHAGHKGFALPTLMSTSHAQFVVKFSSLAMDLEMFVTLENTLPLYRKLLIDMSVIDSVFIRAHSLKHFHIEH